MALCIQKHIFNFSAKFKRCCYIQIYEIITIHLSFPDFQNSSFVGAKFIFIDIMKEIEG
jgi:hypothetical protein